MPSFTDFLHGVVADCVHGPAETLTAADFLLLDNLAVDLVESGDVEQAWVLRGLIDSQDGREPYEPGDEYAAEYSAGGADALPLHRTCVEACFGWTAGTTLREDLCDLLDDLWEAHMDVVDPLDFEMF